MSPFRKSVICAVMFAFGLGGAGAALAQTTSPAQVAVPISSCEKPGDPPRVLSTAAGREDAERKRNAWLKTQRSYVDCLKQFLDDEQAAAAAHVKAVNATAEELNKAVKAYNEQAEAARQ